MRRRGRSRLWSALIALAVAVGLVISVSMAAIASASPPSTATHYFYDPDGQLKALVEPATETAFYTWDPVGNLLSISRHASNTLAVAELTPSHGAAGETITIAGNGFSETSSADDVKFNGTSATVTLATATSLTVTVPAGASSGAVTVQTASEGPAVSPESFTVTSSAAPTIASLSTTLASPGAELTISGTNFESNPSENVVTVNRSRPELGAESSTAIKLMVPASGSGRVAVATPNGTATGPDLFIPPNGIPTSKIGATGRFTLGGSTTVKFTEAETYGIAIFDGAAGQHVSLAISESTIESGTVSIWGPDGSKLLGAEATFSKSAGGFDDGVTLPSTGTYTVLIDPAKAYTGGAKITSYAFSEDVTASVTPTEAGASQTIETATPGQNGVVTFSGTAGERVFIETPEVSYGAGCCVVELQLQPPEGKNLAAQYVKTGAYIDTTTLATTGTYSIVVDPSGAATGKLKLTVYTVPEDVKASLTPTEAGVSQTITTFARGQNGVVTFTGTEGERVFIETPEVSYGTGCCVAELELQSPEGKSLASQYVKAGSYVDTTTLAKTGTYSIVVNPIGPATGKLKLTVYTVPADVKASVAPTEAGASQTIETSARGQNGVVTFSGTAGERVFIETPEVSYGAGCCVVELQLQPPEGKNLAAQYVKAGAYVDTTILAKTGTYSIVVNPIGPATGKLKLTVYTVPEDVKASLTPTEAGVSQTITTSARGQNGVVTFTGTEGERVFIETPEVSYGTGCCVAELELQSPEGKSLASQYVKAGSYVDTTTLAKTGTYSIVVNPIGPATGKLKLSIYKVPTDISSTIEIGGAAVTVATTVPGQNAVLTFSGPASKGIKLTLSNVTIGTSTCCSAEVSIKKPDGTSLVGAKNFGTSGTKVESVLTVAGTYTIVIDPISHATGSVRLTLVDPPVARLARGGADIAPLQELAGASFGSESGAARASDILGAGRQSRADRARRSSQSRRRASHANASSRKRPGPSRRFAPGEPHRATGMPARMTVSTNEPATRAFAPSPAWTPSTKGVASRSWQTGDPPTPWETAPSLQATFGATAVSGQVLAQGGLPLAGVHVAIEDTYSGARTDSSGRFLIAGVSPGHHVLIVEADRTREGRYGSYEIGVTLAGGKTTALPYAIWLTRLDPAGDHHIPTTLAKEARLSTPQIPGLEVRIPAGTAITDRAGHPVHDVNITAIPVDRPPFPLPSFAEVPLYFTIQPGGAYLSKGAQIVYPNWGHLPPGQSVQFWNYDPDGRGWYVYGTGTVTRDGKQIMPDRGVKIWQFTGAMIGKEGKRPFPRTCPPGGVEQLICAIYGDPTDLSTGLFVYHKRDLVLPDTIPIVIERTYRQEDANSYSFGMGTAGAYDIRLWSENNYHEAYLLLPDGASILYKRISPGEGFTEAVYEAQGATGEFGASTIRWNSSEKGWDLTLTNGLTYEFGENAPLQAIRDRFGNTLSITREFGNLGPITQITSPHGFWVDLTYDSSNRVTEITDNSKRHVKYTYTSAGLLEKATDAAGRTTSYEYNGAHEMTSITDGRGKKYIEVEYNAHGRVAKQTLDNGGTYRFSYTEEGGQVTAVTATDPRKAELKATFNAEGLLTSETKAAGTEDEEKTSWERQAGTNLLLSETDPLGRKTAYEYDASGNVAKKTVMAGTASARRTEYSYEPGTTELASVTDPLKHTTSYRYGAHGELLSETDPLGHKTSYEYNAEGEPTAISDPLSEVRKLTYEFGELTATTDPLGRATKRFVDSAGRLTSRTTPGGQRTLYEYGPDDELLKITDPLGHVTDYEYNGDRDVVSATDANKHTTSRAYDPMDEVEAETDPLEHSTHATYDQDGNLTELTDRDDRHSTFTYDPLNRLAEARYGVSGESTERTIDYTYDAGDHLTKVVDSATGTYTPEYDAFNNLKSLATPNGTISYNANEDDLRTSMTAPGEEPVEYSYDGANRLTELKRGGEDVSLAYDAANRLTGAILPDGIEEKYGYDEAGEPTSVVYQKGSERLGDVDYAYDANARKEAAWGSVARTRLPEAIASATYNADNEQTERNGAKLSYDADGDLLTDGASEYAWNAQRELAKITGETTASFAYDPFGRRTEKKFGGSSTKVLFDGSNAVQESAGGATTNLLTGLAVDKTYARATGSRSEDLLTDPLGSTVALADASGKIETSYSYDPFGVTTREGAASENEFQYTGRENDGDGLYYNRARYYSPVASRFISEDPLGEAGGGPNLYRYADNNPLGDVDPYGTNPFEVPWPEPPPKCYPNEVLGGSQCSSAPPGEPENPFGPFPPPGSGPPPIVVGP